MKVMHMQLFGEDVIGVIVAMTQALKTSDLALVMKLVSWMQIRSVETGILLWCTKLIVDQHLTHLVPLPILHLLQHPAQLQIPQLSLHPVQLPLTQ